MKHDVTLTTASLLSVLFLTFHLTDDIVRGLEPGGLSNLIGGVLISVVWLYGTLLLASRRSGYVITLLGSLLALGVPVLHMGWAGVGGQVARSGGAFFFVWTLLALGVSGSFGAILSVRGLVYLQRDRSG
jgi:hypothetical protein